MAVVMLVQCTSVHAEIQLRSTTRRIIIVVVGMPNDIMCIEWHATRKRNPCRIT